MVRLLENPPRGALTFITPRKRRLNPFDPAKSFIKAGTHGILKIWPTGWSATMDLVLPLFKKNVSYLVFDNGHQTFAGC
jgi:hypothetical protein